MAPRKPKTTRTAGKQTASASRRARSQAPAAVPTTTRRSTRAASVVAAAPDSASTAPAAANRRTRGRTGAPTPGTALAPAAEAPVSHPQGVRRSRRLQAQAPEYTAVPDPEPVLRRSARLRSASVAPTLAGAGAGLAAVTNIGLGLGSNHLRSRATRPRRDLEAVVEEVAEIREAPQAGPPEVGQPVEEAAQRQNTPPIVEAARESPPAPADPAHAQPEPQPPVQRQDGPEAGEQVSTTPSPSPTSARALPFPVATSPRTQGTPLTPGLAAPAPAIANAQAPAEPSTIARPRVLPLTPATLRSAVASSEAAHPPRTIVGTEQTTPTGQLPPALRRHNAAVGPLQPLAPYSHNAGSNAARGSSNLGAPTATGGFAQFAGPQASFGAGPSTSTSTTPLFGADPAPGPSTQPPPGEGGSHFHAVPPSSAGSLRVHPGTPREEGPFSPPLLMSRTQYDFFWEDEPSRAPLVRPATTAVPTRSTPAPSRTTASAPVAIPTHAPAPAANNAPAAPAVPPNGGALEGASVATPPPQTPQSGATTSPRPGNGPTPRRDGGLQIPSLPPTSESESSASRRTGERHLRGYRTWAGSDVPRPPPAQPPAPIAGPSRPHNDGERTNNPTIVNGYAPSARNPAVPTGPAGPSTQAPSAIVGRSTPAQPHSLNNGPSTPGNPASMGNGAAAPTPQPQRVYKDPSLRGDAKLPALLGSAGLLYDRPSRRDRASSAARFRYMGEFASPPAAAASAPYGTGASGVASSRSPSAVVAPPSAAPPATNAPSATHATVGQPASPSRLQGHFSWSPSSSGTARPLKRKRDADDQSFGKRARQRKEDSPPSPPPPPHSGPPGPPGPPPPPPPAAGAAGGHSSATTSAWQAPAYGGASGSSSHYGRSSGAYGGPSTRHVDGPTCVEAPQETLQSEIARLGDVARSEAPETSEHASAQADGSTSTSQGPRFDKINGWELLHHEPDLLPIRDAFRRRNTDLGRALKRMRDHNDENTLPNTPPKRLREYREYDLQRDGSAAPGASGNPRWNDHKGGFELPLMDLEDPVDPNQVPDRFRHQFSCAGQAIGWLGWNRARRSVRSSLKGSRARGDRPLTPPTKTAEEVRAFRENMRLHIKPFEREPVHLLATAPHGNSVLSWPQGYLADGVWLTADGANIGCHQQYRPPARRPRKTYPFDGTPLAAPPPTHLGPIKPENDSGLLTTTIGGDLTYLSFDDLKGRGTAWSAGPENGLRPKQLSPFKEGPGPGFVYDEENEKMRRLTREELRERGVYLLDTSHLFSRS